MPELAFYRHGEELLRVALSERTTVGRAPECDVSLPDPDLSRVQAEIHRRGERYHLVDRSGHGTRVGGELVTDTPLCDGTDVALGAWRVLFRESAAEDDAPTRVAGGTSLRSPGEAPSASAVRLRVRERGQERVFTVEGDSVAIGKDRSNDLVVGVEKNRPALAGPWRRNSPIRLAIGRQWMKVLVRKLLGCSSLEVPYDHFGFAVVLGDDKMCMLRKDRTRINRIAIGFQVSNVVLSPER